MKLSKLFESMWQRNPNLTKDSDISLIKTPEDAYYYCSWNEKRIAELEPLILKDPIQAVHYAQGVIEGRWPEFEKQALSYPNNTEDYALALYVYARDILHARWPAAENIIKNNGHSAAMYAVNVIKGRFPAGEPAIATDPYGTLEYVERILKGPFPMGEPVLIEYASYAARYALVIGKRFKAAEHSILNCSDDGCRTYKAKYMKKQISEGNIGFSFLDGEYIITNLPATLEYSQLKHLIKITYGHAGESNAETLWEMRILPGEQVSDAWRGTWQEFVAKHPTIKDLEYNMYEESDDYESDFDN